jgi:hypothetical protein
MQVLLQLKICLYFYEVEIAWSNILGLIPLEVVFYLCRTWSHDLMLPFGSEAYHCWAEPFSTMIIALAFAISFPLPAYITTLYYWMNCLGSDSPSYSGRNAGSLNFGGHSTCSKSIESGDVGFALLGYDSLWFLHGLRSTNASSSES